MPSSPVSESEEQKTGYEYLNINIIHDDEAQVDSSHTGVSLAIANETGTSTYNSPPLPPTRLQNHTNTLNLASPVMPYYFAQNSNSASQLPHLPPSNAPSNGPSLGVPKHKKGDESEALTNKTSNVQSIPHRGFADGASIERSFYVQSPPSSHHNSMKNHHELMAPSYQDW